MLEFPYILPKPWFVWKQTMLHLPSDFLKVGKILEACSTYENAQILLLYRTDHDIAKKYQLLHTFM